MRKASVLLLLMLIAVFAGNRPVYAKHDIASDDAIEHFNNGNKFYSAGKYDDAISQFNLALEHNPNDASSNFGLGNSYFLKKNYKRALEHYNKVTAVKPDYAKVHYAMGLAQRRLGNKDEAKKEFELYNNLSKGEKPRTAKKRVEKKSAAAKKRAAAKKEPAESRKLESRKWEEKPADRKLESRAWDKKPGDRKLESRAWVDDGSRTSKAPEEEKKRRARKVEPKERKKIEEEAKKRFKKREKAVTVKKGVKKEKRTGNKLKTLWNSSPVGKIFLSLFAYTFVAQVWIGLVVLVCVIFVWRKQGRR